MRMSSGAHPAATAAAARRSSASVLPERAGPTILAVRPSKAAISAIMSVMSASYSAKMPLVESKSRVEPSA